MTNNKNKVRKGLELFTEEYNDARSEVQEDLAIIKVLDTIYNELIENFNQALSEVKAMIERMMINKEEK